MQKTQRFRAQAAIVAIAPLVLLVGLAYHPYIPAVPRDIAVLAEQVAADTTRWGIAHVTVAVGYGLLTVAFLAIRAALNEAGEDYWSGVALSLVVIGNALFTMLPGMEFAPLVAARTGSDIQAAQETLLPWFVPILAAGALCFGLGALGFAVGIVRARLLSPRMTRLVVGALIVFAVARFVPLGAVQFYVQGAAGILALWPLAYARWQQSAARAARKPRAMPVT